MRVTYLPMSYRIAANMDAVLYLVGGDWEAFADEVYRRGGDDLGDKPEWMGA
jgi:hypothetical protein